MSAFFMLYRIWFQIAAVVALVGAGWWAVHTYNESLREDGRQEVRAEYQAKLIEAQADAKKKEQGFAKQIGEANAKANQREQKLRTAAADSNAAVVSLRDSLHSLGSSLSNATPAAVAESARAISAVLGNCVQEYSSMAALGDRHSSDSQRCIESWPKVELR